jgi:hypothetical protein
MAILVQTLDRTSSRTAGLLFIVALHLLLGYGLVHGIGVYTIFKDPNEALKMIFVDSTPHEPKPVVKMEAPKQLEVTTPEPQLPELVPPQQEVAATDAQPPIAESTTNAVVDAAPTVETSSGFSRLEEATLKWAREALTFHAATRDGVPVQACKGFRVNLRLKERSSS